MSTPLERLNADFDLHKERCKRILAEQELREIKDKHKKEIAELEYELSLAKKNWWRRFRLPKVIWRDEYNE